MFLPCFTLYLKTFSKYQPLGWGTPIHYLYGYVASDFEAPDLERDIHFRTGYNRVSVLGRILERAIKKLAHF